MTLAAKASTPRSTLFYDWEALYIRSYYDLPRLSLVECQEIVNRTWAKYGTGRVPTVLDGRGSKFSRAGRHSIHLRRDSRNERTILHEVAHSLTISDCGTKYVGDSADHGPDYAKVLMKLYAEYMSVDEDYLWKTYEFIGL